MVDFDPITNVDNEELCKYVDNGWISIRSHPSMDLWILNYTKKCAVDRAWDRFTTQCRGLIIDAEGNVKYRPMPKFFNMEELPALGIKIPDGSGDIFEKYDGSMGILYFNADNQPCIATRGSFYSDQADEVNTHRDIYFSGFNFSAMDPSYTYLFEIIYPENKVVVDYGTERKLVLLAKIRTSDGLDSDYLADGFVPDGNLPKMYSKLHWEELRAVYGDKSNSEGFVVRFPGGFRMKIKLEEYCRLHNVMSHTSSKSLWELAKSGGDVGVVIDSVPAHFRKWVETNWKNLHIAHSSSKVSIEGFFKEISSKCRNKKEFAELVSKNFYKSELFSLWDNNGKIDEIIWNRLKPKYSRPYVEDE